MRTLIPVPLTADAFAPYGTVIAANVAGARHRTANLGTAIRYECLDDVDNRRPGRARLAVSVYRCTPCSGPSLRMTMLEKHGASTQVFVPMNASRSMVVVARRGDHPDLGSLAAFIATGEQGVAYHAGVWHHPMIALDRETDFTCMVWEDGTAEDCTEHALEEPIAVAIPSGPSSYVPCAVPHGALHSPDSRSASRPVR